MTCEWSVNEYVKENVTKCSAYLLDMLSASLQYNAEISTELKAHIANCLTFQVVLPQLEQVTAKQALTRVIWYDCAMIDSDN